MEQTKRVRGCGWQVDLSSRWTRPFAFLADALDGSAMRASNRDLTLSERVQDGVKTPLELGPQVRVPDELDLEDDRLHFEDGDIESGAGIVHRDEGEVGWIDPFRM
jgi:hypothetical protein